MSPALPPGSAHLPDPGLMSDPYRLSFPDLMSDSDRVPAFETLSDSGRMPALETPSGSGLLPDSAPLSGFALSSALPAAVHRSGPENPPMPRTGSAAPPFSLPGSPYGSSNQNGCPSERHRAYDAQLSPDCRVACSACGAQSLLPKGVKCDG